MAKLVTIQRGQAASPSIVKSGAKSGEGEARPRNEAASLSELKLPFAVAIAVLASVGLGAAVLHARGANAEHELPLSQAHNQVQRKLSGFPGTHAPIIIGSASGKSSQVGPK